MNRRGFIGAIIGSGAAPAIVRASSLMPIVPRANYVWTPYSLGFQSLVCETEIVKLTLAKHRMEIIDNLAKYNDLYKEITSYYAGKSIM